MPENLEILSLPELRQKWGKAWDSIPHARIGRIMLVKSLAYKNDVGLAPEIEARLSHLIQQYKRNPRCFDEVDGILKPGTRLVRKHEGKKHTVLVKTDGFEYEGKIYNSLSKIANDITGSKWNGWVFFGLKKVGAA